MSSLEGREKLQKIINDLVKRSKSRRAFARSLGVSASAVISWENGAIPDTKNLAKIAMMAGYTLDEIKAVLDGKPHQQAKPVDAVIKDLENLPREDVLRVVKTGAELLLTMAG
ncbi:helix-turn-helix domain-containing protein [Pseudanabaena sp. PCC 6802]|uniref:helix-turn-helix domain-containing protein n=1 Tax=Pseudanabaena sp. PCC 6802 TaxID=118173 RepID=UPI00037F84AC|nr:helix-turn-helix transcriptional regulator [Pseudanabaena sp. PCC 6802]